MINNYADMVVVSAEYDRLFKTRKIGNEIPAIRFPEQWEIRITPPFLGATIRFRVLCDGAEVSVYLDYYEMLGTCNEPYWEIYPADGGDVKRYRKDNIDGLLKGIWDSIKYQTDEEVL